jgi:hypothetical protein
MLHYLETVNEWMDKASEIVTKHPHLEELYKGYNEHYEDYFAYSEEIGSSDMNICLDTYFKDNNTTWEKESALFIEAGLSMKWFFNQHDWIESFKLTTAGE